MDHFHTFYHICQQTIEFFYLRTSTAYWLSSASTLEYFRSIRSRVRLFHRRPTSTSFFPLFNDPSRIIRPVIHSRLLVFQRLHRIIHESPSISLPIAFLPAKPASSGVFRHLYSGSLGSEISKPIGLARC